MTLMTVFSELGLAASYDDSMVFILLLVMM